MTEEARRAALVGILKLVNAAVLMFVLFFLMSLEHLADESVNL